MKRKRLLLAEIAAQENLALAVWKAAKGKRHRNDVIQFTTTLDNQLESLAAAILQARVPYGNYREFSIRDPKPRKIHAACFADRVLHHAIMNLAEPVFERSLVDSTFACRPGKGVHKAVVRVQENIRRYPWYVKTDISGYFPAVDHAALFKLLQKRFKGEDFLYLLWRIINSWHIQPGKGLLIGSLTSQYFANYYLDGADRFLLEKTKVSAHVRYMDDTVFWCQSKAEAAEKLAEFAAFLSIDRKLQIKPNTLTGRSEYGIMFCGYRILPGAVLLSRRKRYRYQRLRQHLEREWLDGRVDSLELQHAYSSVHAITLHADSQEWRKKNLCLHPSLPI